MVNVKVIIAVFLLVLTIFLKPVHAELFTDGEKISIYMKVIEYCDKKYPSDFEKFIFEKGCRKEQMDSCLEFFELPMTESDFFIAMEILKKHGFTTCIFRDTIDWKSVLRDMKIYLNKENMER